MATYRLTDDAEHKLAILGAALDELGLTIEQAHALSLAASMAEECNESNEGEGRDSLTPDDIVERWAEDGREAWADVLCEAPAFLTEE